MIQISQFSNQFNSYDDFNFWFNYVDYDTYTVSKNGEVIGKMVRTLKDADFKFDSFELGQPANEVLEDWKKFQLRPEFKVGRPITLDGEFYTDVRTSFIDLLIGCLLIRAKRNNKFPDDFEPYIDRVVNWIDSTDFYTSPASTRYHESFTHGLLYHTCSVYNNIIELHKISKFQGVPIDSCALCALVHDWCKIGLYESYKRNVKNENTGKWEQVDSYRRRQFPHAFGHGVSSMYMAMQLFKLSEEEALSIRWHMSMFNVASNEINEYQQACEQYPLVHLIQFADQLSIVEY